MKARKEQERQDSSVPKSSLYGPHLPPQDSPSLPTQSPGWSPVQGLGPEFRAGRSIVDQIIDKRNKKGKGKGVFYGPPAPPSRNGPFLPQPGDFYDPYHSGKRTGSSRGGRRINTPDHGVPDHDLFANTRPEHTIAAIAAGRAAAAQQAASKNRSPFGHGPANRSPKEPRAEFDSYLAAAEDSVFDVELQSKVQNFVERRMRNPEPVLVEEDVDEHGHGFSPRPYEGPLSYNGPTENLPLRNITAARLSYTMLVESQSMQVAEYSAPRRYFDPAKYRAEQEDEGPNVM